MAGKLMAAQEAIGRFVRDGDSMFLGQQTLAFGLAREVVRQRRHDLILVGANHSVASLLLTVNGCAPKAICCYMAGTLWPGILHEMIRSGEFQFEDYTNQTMTMMLMAGALGIPFIPTRSMLGSDFLAPENLPQPGGFLGENKLKVMSSPFDGRPVVLLPAIRLGVCLLHVQWADEEGNAVYWGGHGEQKWAAWAADRVIVSAEEIVPGEVIRSDPHRVVLPGIRVSAVVHMPWGAVPSTLPGYHRNENRFVQDLATSLRSREAVRLFAEEWVDGCPDHEAFLGHYREQYGDDILERLKIDVRHEPKRSIWYGYDSS